MKEIEYLGGFTTSHIPTDCVNGLHWLTVQQVGLITYETIVASHSN